MQHGPFGSATTCSAGDARAAISQLLVLEYLDDLAVAAVQNAQTGGSCV